MNKSLAIILILSIFSLNVHAGSSRHTYGNLKVLEVLSIYDGDTFRANIENVHPIIGSNIPIRLARIDTPEMRGKCNKEKLAARQAKQFTVAMLRRGKEIVLANIKRGRHFRIVADVYIDGVNLTDALLSNGHGIRYNGGVKSKNWCE